MTQAIQYCRASEHLTDANDRGADNSLTLVADKPAVVRVYVHGRFADEPNVRGTVTVQRRRFGVWVDAGTLTQAAPASLTAFSDAPYASERGQLRGSLNFMVPGEAMIGEMRLVVHVEQVGRPDRNDYESVVVDRHAGTARRPNRGRLHGRVRVGVHHLAGLAPARGVTGRHVHLE